MRRIAIAHGRLDFSLLVGDRLGVADGAGIITIYAGCLLFLCGIVALGSYCSSITCQLNRLAGDC